MPDTGRIAQKKVITKHTRRVLTLGLAEHDRSMRMQKQRLITQFKRIIKVARYPGKVVSLTVKLAVLRGKIRSEKKSPVLVLTHELSATGASILLLKIAEVLAREGHEVVMLAPLGSKPSEHIRAFLPPRENMFFLEANSWLRRFFIRSLARMGVNRGIGNTVLSGVWAPLLKQYGFHTAFLVHEMWASVMILQAQRQLRLIAEYADHLVFPAEEVQRSLSVFELPLHAQMHCLPQGYYKKAVPQINRKNAHARLCVRLSIPPEAFIVTGAGTFTFGKGIDLLTLIAAQVVRQEPATHPIHVIWMGERFGTPYEYWVQVQVHQLGLEDRFHFLGFVADEEKYLSVLAGSDVYALVSREDSYPSVVLEALQCTLPVVAFSDSGGGAWLAGQGAGYVVPYADTEAFAQRLLWLMDNAEEANTQVEKAQLSLAEKMDFVRYVRRLMEMTEHK